MNGTVVSGHPTRTTLGNFLRVRALVMFLIKQSKIPSKDYDASIAGDDCWIVLNEEYINDFMKSIRRYTIEG